jgi:hypothetical protein
VKRAHIVYSAVAVSLVVLNVLRWLPSQPEQAAHSVRRQQLTPQDLDLRVGAIAADVRPVARDLFQERAAPAARAATPKVAAKPAGPPPKSAEELAMEQAQAEFDSIKVVAIVFQDGVGQAFVSLGENSQIVGVGDALSERFKVEAINVDGVELRAVDGTIGGRVALTGS